MDYYDYTWQREVFGPSALHDTIEIDEKKNISVTYQSVCAGPIDPYEYSYEEMRNLYTYQGERTPLPQKSIDKCNGSNVCENKEFFFGEVSHGKPSLVDDSQKTNMNFNEMKIHLYVKKKGSKSKEYVLINDTITNPLMFDISKVALQFFYDKDFDKENKVKVIFNFRETEKKNSEINYYFPIELIVNKNEKLSDIYHYKILDDWMDKSILRNKIYWEYLVGKYHKISNMDDFIPGEKATNGVVHLWLLY